MRDLKVLLHLASDEHILSIWRMHGAELWLRILPYGLLICFLSFLSFFLVQSGFVGVVLLSGLFGFSFYRILWAFRRWDTNAFVITTKRLIFLQREQIWNTVVQDLSLKDIVHITMVKQKGWRRWFSLSNVTVQGIPNRVFKLSSMKKDKAFAEALKTAKEKVYS